METDNSCDIRLCEIEGKSFDDYIEDIWSCLMDADDVFRIGIHGIGGVGKTHIARYISNKVLQNPDKFGHVFWVSMSPNWSNWNRASPLCRVRDLQSSVSKAVGVDLSDGDDEIKRAAQLAKGLAEKKKSVLILDDVWDYISLPEVGIPDGFTVLFTTRSSEVCRQLGCQRNIEIKCLPPDESYELFKKKLGKETTLSSEIEEISRLVTRECAGLPLAITIMARNMRGVTDKCIWRTAVRGQLRKKADMELFQKLRKSYDYLKDTTLQHCFLHCALLLEILTKKRRLAEYLIDVGIIKNTSSRREELDKAFTMLDFLLDAGLLEITSSNYYVGMDKVTIPNLVGMNKLIRSMALQIMEESQPRGMVIKGMSLKDFLDEESLTEDLVTVILEVSQIENIPCNYSPRCSNLSTLVLNPNPKLGYIGDSFFEGMPRLKVLDLSHAEIESLPASVCGLVGLTALVLSCCSRLKNIPSLAKLKELKKLDLSYSGVKKLPEDIEALSKLTYLDLFMTFIEEFNSEILANFYHLQFLRLPFQSAVKGEVVAHLGRMERLSCRFVNVVELNNYLMHLKGGFKKRDPPLQLCIQVGQSFVCANDLLYDGDDEKFAEKDDDWSEIGLINCGIGLNNCDIIETDMLNSFQEIIIGDCNGARSLCNFPPIKGATELKHISIQECDRLEFVCSLPATGQDILENIECMALLYLEKLSVIVRKEGDLAYGGSCFSNLTRFLIECCPSMKRLFPTNLVPNLKNLQRLYVIHCRSMEEIFGEEESEIAKKKICCLPKLSILWLASLPELKQFCGGGTICSLSKGCSIKVDGCPKFPTDGVAVFDI